MLESELAGRVLAGIRQGRYALLLGAGFSAEAESKNGKPLPLSGALAQELADRFSMPAGHPLSRLWPALPTPQREQYLEERFRSCRVPANLHHLRSLVWRAIYTLNIDDVVQQIYRDSEKKQSLETLTFQDLFSTPESIAILRCIHLHGSVLHPDAGYVFGTPDYAAATVHHHAWGP